VVHPTRSPGAREAVCSCGMLLSDSCEETEVFTLQKACLAKHRSEHSYKRASSYTDVASMKLKQDVESSWQCPFVSVSEEKSGAQHAFCNVKSPPLSFARVALWMRTRKKAKHNKRSAMRNPLSLLFAWVVLWMRMREKASACCVSVGDSPLSPFYIESSTMRETALLSA